ncbi:MAG TPA: hypothetical protein VHB45_13040 [Alloacidobacterium sp.]|nr:hypothetical protein [Alloacidobacterium sp.]
MTKRKRKKTYEAPPWNRCGFCEDGWIVDANGARRCDCWLDWKARADAVRQKEGAKHAAR